MIQTERLELKVQCELLYIVLFKFEYSSYLSNSVPISLKIVMTIEVSTEDKKPPMQRLYQSPNVNIKPLDFRLSIRTIVQSKTMKLRLIDV